jgi:hypothetical protein
MLLLNSWKMNGAVHWLDSHDVNDNDNHIDTMSLTEITASALATLAVCAIIWLAITGDESARTALTGLVGGATAYFLTPKVARNGKPPTTGATP